MDNGNAPATRADIDRLDQKIDRFDRKLDDSIAQIRAEVSHAYHDLAERIHDTETQLLNAFYGFAETNQKQVIQLQEADAGLSRRVGTLEIRMLEVEKRLNLPLHP